MHFRDLLARELGPSAQGQETMSLEKTCKPVSWHRWCPVDIALWIVITLIIILLLWKVHRSHRVDHDSEEQRQIAPNATHRDKTSFESGSTSLDPYLVVHSLGDSLVAKDPSFQSVSIPQPVLEKSSSRQLTGLGITIGSRPLSATLTDLSLSRSLTTATSTTSYSATIVVASDEEKDDDATSKIRTAHVHNIHLDV